MPKTELLSLKLIREHSLVVKRKSPKSQSRKKLRLRPKKNQRLLDGKRKKEKLLLKRLKRKHKIKLLVVLMKMNYLPQRSSVLSSYSKIKRRRLKT